MSYWWAFVPVAAACAWVVRAAVARLQLSRAKHPSVQGHARIAKRLARLLPAYDHDETSFFACDDAPGAVVARRREAFGALAHRLQQSTARSCALTDITSHALPDLQFTSRYRVPFPFSRYVRSHLPVGAFVERTSGPRIEDLDGNVRYDLTGSYGANVFGHEVYKACMAEAGVIAGELGPVLGSYHPVVAENVRRLCAISGHDAVSFHMSGTEAVMQAVRLARYHTRRSHVVQFCGAYHGWWDDVQPGVGNPHAVGDTYVLRDQHPATLRVLRTRRDIACVLVNPLQALHPNLSAPGDSTLVASDRRAGADLAAYGSWLRELAGVCRERNIVLVFDEVFVGFRLAYGGAQEYFGVRADLVTYGKTVAGGFPIGVVCGRRELMQRFRDDRPSDICFARGTFNAHAYVMAGMHAFLRRLDAGTPDTPPLRESYDATLAAWDRRIAELNARLQAEHLPIRLAHLASIATVLYTQPSRYNWLFQYYLRAHGLALSWVGTGRLVFSHDFTEADFAAVVERFVAAAREMRDGGWWAGGLASNRAIRRRVLRELLAARIARLTERAPRRAVPA